MRLRLSRGRCFAAVSASSGRGRYTLSRVSRTITSTRVTFNGSRRAGAAPGRAARIGVRVSPAESGPVTVLVERFDPLAGWQFLRRYAPRVSGGGTTLLFQPPAVGRFRARAEFRGTRRASPSESGYATLRVAGALQSSAPAGPAAEAGPGPRARRP